MSSSVGEASYEDKKWENGVFTEALLELLNNALNIPDGLINIQQARGYLESRVPELLQESGLEKHQHPSFKNKGLPNDLILFSLNNNGS